MAIPETPGERLERAIKEARLTQTAVAERVGVARKTVNRWVGNHDPIPDARYPELARILGRSEAWLRGDGVTPQGLHYDPGLGDPIAYSRGVSYAVLRMLNTMQELQAEVLDATMKKPPQGEAAAGGEEPQDPVRQRATARSHRVGTGRGERGTRLG